MSINTTEVQELLQKIENEYNVRILYATEVGSRAYGLASSDSDYDVRFIFIGRSVDEYILNKVPETITLFSEDKVHDFVGFELRKAIKLYRGGNCSVVEWMTSEIVHRDVLISEDEEWGTLGEQITQMKLDRLTLMESYASLAKGMRKQFAGDRNAQGLSLKKYFYVIRPTMILQWYMQRAEEEWTAEGERAEGQCPLDFQTLAGELALSEEVKRALGELFLIKTTQSKATRIGERIACIDEWIDDVIGRFDPEQYQICRRNSVDTDVVGNERKNAEDLILRTVHSYSPI